MTSNHFENGRAIVGVDVGGTFTDFVTLEASGELRVWKLPSTPADPSQAVLAGLQAWAGTKRPASGYALIHGTTVATNALLQRRGAHIALLTTIGFRDVLEIGRQARAELYALDAHKPPPLVPRQLCREISGRLDWQGRVLAPLDEREITDELAALRASGVESLAVCLLFAHLNPSHERRVRELAHCLGFTVSLSHEVAPEPGEFERASTTSANAFVQPLLRDYLTRLEAGAQQAGAEVMSVMASAGGALSASEAAKHAVATVLSGPAGGVVAASRIGAEAGFDRLLTFDMGGTSTDVALVLSGECPQTSAMTLSGMPLRIPSLDIHTVGAGGGSLARVDAGGGLRVGPQSAGADPGPACYGRGSELTVTDANVVLGRLPAIARLAGGMELDANRASALFDKLAARLGTTIEVAALGVIRVADAAMTRALRLISLERGHDPADFTLLSFGGAGGLHACSLAEELGVRTILIPRFPGAFSALGLALADVRRDMVQALPPTGPLPAVGGGWSLLTSHLRTLEVLARREAEPHALLLASLEMRYVGQSFSLPVPWSTDLPSAELIENFHAAHRQRYGHADPDEPVEAVAVRLTTVQTWDRPVLHISLPSAPGKPVSHAPVYFPGGWRETAIYSREQLGKDQKLDGPVVIIQPDATILLPPGWQGRVDASGNFIMVSIIGLKEDHK